MAPGQDNQDLRAERSVELIRAEELWEMTETKGWQHVLELFEQVKSDYLTSTKEKLTENYDRYHYIEDFLNTINGYIADLKIK